MRVIAGKARRLNLVTVPGMDTRPTTDRVKETLFNILQPSLGGCRFLDLFAGSGGIGIEALSRGAASCVFVENNRKAQNCIEQNLVHTKLADQGKLLRTDVLSALNRLEREQQEFDMIFMDPPYGMEWEKRVLEVLRHSALVSPDTWIIVEANLETNMDYVESMGFEIFRVKEYKTNQHYFIKKIAD
ncbi:MAG: 16S rRNA (guanine(966)-N(2))-methyltransferase RsmD [Clostridiales bacterium]|nr:16S rRNA (guanine(966)-N(2))-methyltransferase RsmD [Clostridiales bacterium]